MSNTDIWDKLKRPPADQLKSFTRGGGFKGTAVRPMWTIHKMTEVFGPCGDGWGIDEPSFQVVNGHNNEVMVYCTVSIWHEMRDRKVFGVGGDKIVSHIKANEQYKRPERWENDDEAFKKAFTDAVTNALKHIGAAADIHMNLWDGSKYVTPADETEAPPAPRMGLVGGTPAASKAANREAYNKMAYSIRNAPTLKALDEWRKNNSAAIDDLPPDWLDELRVEFLDRKNELEIPRVA